MPANYTLGQHFEQFIEDQLESGRYRDASEIVRAGLRLLEEHEQLRAARIEALRTTLREGIQSGSGLPAEAVFDRLEARLRQAEQQSSD